MFSFEHNFFWGWGSKLSLVIALNLHKTPLRGACHTPFTLFFVRLIQLDGMHTQTDGDEKLTQNARDKKQRMLHKRSAALIPSSLEYS